MDKELQGEVKIPKEFAKELKSSFGNIDKEETLEVAKLEKPERIEAKNPDDSLECDWWKTSDDSGRPDSTETALNYARENSILLHKVTGTGSEGKITLRDVKKYHKNNE